MICRTEASTNSPLCHHWRRHTPVWTVWLNEAADHNSRAPLQIMLLTSVLMIWIDRGDQQRARPFLSTTITSDNAC